MLYREFIDSIKNSRPNVWFEYSERHHIIPRCLGGTDDENNFIYLTYREHFIAHKLLHEENPNNRELAYAIAIMSKHGQLDSIEYASVKKTLSEAWSGENNPNYGNHKSLIGEHLERVRENHVRGESHPYYGKQLDEDHRRKISETMIINRSSKGSNNPMYGVHRYGEDSPHYGHKHSEESRKKMSESAKNRPPVSEETKKKLSESRRRHNMDSRKYDLVCRKCQRHFQGREWNTRYCDKCREELIQGA